MVALRSLSSRIGAGRDGRARTAQPGWRLRATLARCAGARLASVALGDPLEATAAEEMGGGQR
jgi:hypothetical protein